MATSEKHTETWSSDIDRTHVNPDAKYEVHARSQRREWGELNGKKGYFPGWWSGGRARQLEYAFEKKHREMTAAAREEMATAATHEQKLAAEQSMRKSEETFRFHCSMHGIDRTVVEASPHVDGVCWGDGTGAPDPKDNSGKLMIEVAATCHVIYGWQLQQLMDEQDRGMPIMIQKYRRTDLPVDRKDTTYAFATGKVYCKSELAKLEAVKAG